MTSRSVALLNPFARTSAAKIKTQSAIDSPLSKTYLLSVGLLGICAVVLFSYILGVNSYTSAGYQIKQMQNQLSGLTDQNRQLTLQISEASSIVQIQTDFL